MNSPEEREIPVPPRGWQHVKWLGPAFLWMVAAAGSGELLFTPRIGAQYGYTLLWALVAAVALKWFINREIGRYAVCTGATVLQGFAQMPGPRAWAVWLIVIPQVFVAVATIAGIGATASTAVILARCRTGKTLETVLLLLGGAAVVWRGSYSAVEKAATIRAYPRGGEYGGSDLRVSRLGRIRGGVRASNSWEREYEEVLPWLGFALVGAAGMMCYSYWLPAKGYGAGDATRSGRSTSRYAAI